MEDTDSLPSCTLKITMTEPALQGVKQDDRTLVRNVLYMLHACKHPERMCTSWSVTNNRTGSGYEIIGLIDQSKDYEIFKEDFDLIKLADPLRVQSISLRKSCDALQIVIKVLSKSEPVMMTEIEVMSIQRKRRRGE
jgi:hypothetical protein